MVYVYQKLTIPPSTSITDEPTWEQKIIDNIADLTTYPISTVFAPKLELQLKSYKNCSNQEPYKFCKLNYR